MGDCPLDYTQSHTHKQTERTLAVQKTCPMSFKYSL